MPQLFLGSVDTKVDSGVGSWNVQGLPCFSRHESQTGHGRTPVPPMIDVQMMKSWLRSCCSHHNHSDVHVDVLTRLSNLRAKGWIRAIHTKSHQISPLPENAKYATLSYIWGAKSFFHSKLPRTVAEALDLTAQLGYEWLWVDRL